MKRSLVSAFYGISLLWGVITLTFMLFFIAPGDPARIMLGLNASEEAVQRLREELGTDKPIWEQYWLHISKLLHLNLGRSTLDGRLVSPEVTEKFLTTLKLGGMGLLIALILSYALNLFVFYFSSSLAIFNPYEGWCNNTDFFFRSCCSNYIRSSFPCFPIDRIWNGRITLALSRPSSTHSEPLSSSSDDEYPEGENFECHAH